MSSSDTHAQMGSTTAAFEQAAERVKMLPRRPATGQLLELYGLYKQATVGDNNSEKPGMLDFQGQAKWASWDSVRGVHVCHTNDPVGMSQSEAQQQYIDLVSSLAARDR